MSTPVGQFIAGYTLRLKPLLVLLFCIVVVRLFRHFFVAPWMSLATIGSLRLKFGQSTDADGVMYADTAQDLLFSAFDAWIMVDIAIDVLVLAVVLATLCNVAERAKLPESREA